MPVRSLVCQSRPSAAACAVLAAALALLACHPELSSAQPACAVPGLDLNVRHYSSDLTSVSQNAALINLLRWPVAAAAVLT